MNDFWNRVLAYFWLPETKYVLLAFALLAVVALQLDNSLQTGDWVKLDDLSGRVLQIRWRQTTIRTRNGENVVPRFRDSNRIEPVEGRYFQACR